MHLPPSTATAKGHITQEQQHLQSTKNKISQRPPKESDDGDLDDDYCPSMETTSEKQNEVIYAIVEHSKKDFGYMDLTGKFPFVSARGNQYILVAYG